MAIIYQLTVRDPGDLEAGISQYEHRHIYTDPDEAESKRKEAEEKGFEAKLDRVQSKDHLPVTASTYIPDEECFDWCPLNPVYASTPAACPECGAELNLDRDEICPTCQAPVPEITDPGTRDRVGLPPLTAQDGGSGGGGGGGDGGSSGGGDSGDSSGGDSSGSSSCGSTGDFCACGGEHMSFGCSSSCGCSGFPPYGEYHHKKKRHRGQVEEAEDSKCDECDRPAISTFEGKHVCPQHLRAAMEKIEEELPQAIQGINTTIGPTRLRWENVVQETKQDEEQGKKSLEQYDLQERIKDIQSQSAVVHEPDPELKEKLAQVTNLNEDPYAPKGETEVQLKGKCMRCGKDVHAGDASDFGDEEWACSSCAPLVAQNIDLYKSASAEHLAYLWEQDHSFTAQNLGCPNCLGTGSMPDGKVCQACFGTGHGGGMMIHPSSIQGGSGTGVLHSIFVTPSGHRLRLWEDTAYKPSKWELREENHGRFSGPFETHQEVQQELSRLNAIEFPKWRSSTAQTVGILYGDDGDTYQTDDGGTTWKKIGQNQGWRSVKIGGPVWNRMSGEERMDHLVGDHGMRRSSLFSQFGESDESQDYAEALNGPHDRAHNRMYDWNESGEAYYHTHVAALGQDCTYCGGKLSDYRDAQQIHQKRCVDCGRAYTVGNEGHLLPVLDLDDWKSAAVRDAGLHDTYVSGHDSGELAPGAQDSNGYFAGCNDCGWVGTLRKAQEFAEDDAYDHICGSTTPDRPDKHECDQCGGTGRDSGVICQKCKGWGFTKDSAAEHNKEEEEEDDDIKLFRFDHGPGEGNDMVHSEIHQQEHTGSVLEGAFRKETAGRCVSCGKRTHDNDYPLDSSDSGFEAFDYDMEGPDVPQCFVCNNDYNAYTWGLEKAKERWKPKTPRLASPSDTAFDTGYRQGIENQVSEDTDMPDSLEGMVNAYRGGLEAGKEHTGAFQKTSPYGIPKSKGGDSEANDAKMEKCVAKVMKSGKPKKNAIAICKDSLGFTKEEHSRLAWGKVSFVDVSQANGGMSGNGCGICGSATHGSKSCPQGTDSDQPPTAVKQHLNYQQTWPAVVGQAGTSVKDLVDEVGVGHRVPVELITDHLGLIATGVEPARCRYCNAPIEMHAQWAPTRQSAVKKPKKPKSKDELKAEESERKRKRDEHAAEVVEDSAGKVQRFLKGGPVVSKLGQAGTSVHDLVDNVGTGEHSVPVELIVDHRGEVEPRTEPATCRLCHRPMEQHAQFSPTHQRQASFPKRGEL